MDVPFIKEVSLALFKGDSLEELKAFNTKLENAYMFNQDELIPYLKEYISYINKDIRSLESNVHDIRQALIIKNGYKSLMEINQYLPDFILKNYPNPDDKVKLNVMMKKLYASSKLLNNQNDEYDIFKNYASKKNIVWKLKKEDGLIYGNDEMLAMQKCKDFFNAAISMSSSFCDNLLLKEKGLDCFKNPECQIFIGGKSIEEIKNSKYSDMAYKDAKDKILLNALKQGNEAIELVVYNNEKPKVITLKIDYTDAKMNSNYYSKFRKFFSGIFKIRPNHTYEKALAKIDDKKTHDDNLIQKFNSMMLFANLKKKQSDLSDRKSSKKSIIVEDSLLTNQKNVIDRLDSKKIESELKK